MSGASSTATKRSSSTRSALGTASRKAAQHPKRRVEHREQQRLEHCEQEGGCPAAAAARRASRGAARAAPRGRSGEHGAARPPRSEQCSATTEGRCDRRPRSGRYALLLMSATGQGTWATGRGSAVCRMHTRSRPRRGRRKRARPHSDPCEQRGMRCMPVQHAALQHAPIADLDPRALPTLLLRASPAL